MHGRVDMDRLLELVRLHRMGTGSREVARLLRMGPNTERQYRQALAQAGLLDGEPSQLPELDVLKSAVLAALPSKVPPQQVSSIEGWVERIGELQAKELGPQAIYDKLRLEDEGFRESRAGTDRRHP